MYVPIFLKTSLAIGLNIAGHLLLSGEDAYRKSISPDDLYQSYGPFHYFMQKCPLYYTLVLTPKGIIQV